MIKPKYSILIPTYNRQNLIAETLDCAFNQDYPNLEIIVVDNCSNDDTWAILLKYQSRNSKLKIFRNQTNLGPVLNWKACLDQSTGEYGKFLYSDDLISTNFVSETMAVFCDNTAFVLGSVVVFKESKTEKAPIEFPLIIKSKKYLEDIIFFGRYRFPVSPSSASFRIEDLKKNLLIEIPNPIELEYKRYGAGNDLLLFLISCQNRMLVRSSPKAIAYFRNHPGSLTIANILTPYYHFAIEYYILNYEPAQTRNWTSASFVKQKMGRLSFSQKTYGIDFNTIVFIIRKLYFKLLSIF